MWYRIICNTWIQQKSISHYICCIIQHIIPCCRWNFYLNTCHNHKIAPFNTNMFITVSWQHLLWILHLNRKPKLCETTLLFHENSVYYTILFIACITHYQNFFLLPGTSLTNFVVYLPLIPPRTSKSHITCQKMNWRKHAISGHSRQPSNITKPPCLH